MKGAWTFSNIKGGGTLQPKYLWPLTLGPRRGLTRARILIFQCEKGRRQSSDCAEEILHIMQYPTICGLLALIGELGRQMKRKGRDGKDEKVGVVV